MSGSNKPEEDDSEPETEEEVIESDEEFDDLLREATQNEPGKMWVTTDQEFMHSKTLFA